MADFGLQPYGFVRPSLNDIIDEYNVSARENYGEFANLGDNSRLGTLFKIFAYQDSQLWGLMEGVYNSRTLSGAEGKYLDDILSRRGIFRRNAEPGTGEVVIQTDRFTPWLQTLSLSSQFSSNTGKTYTPRAVRQFRDNIFAYRISQNSAQSISNIINFFARNYSDGQIYSISLNTTSTAFLTDLRDFILSNIDPEDADRVHINQEDKVLYVGFKATDFDTPAGLRSSIFFYSDVNVGNKWSVFELVCTEAGVFTVQVGGITQINPPFSGYVSVYNYREFNPGSEVETDAEYRLRASALGEEALASTKPAVIKALLDLNGVSKVKIYDNPTSQPSLEAVPFSFDTIVYGGVSSEIINTIAQKKPINTLTDGTETGVYTYEDTSTEIIKFTPALVKNINVRLTYSTVDSLPLNGSETNRINEAIADQAASYTIGGVVSILQIQAAVLSSVAVGKFSSLTVEVKFTTESDVEYTTENKSLQFNEIAVLNSEDDIIYNQTV